MQRNLARVALSIVAAVTLSARAADAAASPCARAIVTLTVTWDPSRAETVSGVVARLSYPTTLEIPVDGDGSAAARVENRTGRAGGLFDAVRKDTDQDGTGDLLNVGLITEGIEPGDFVRIRFECRPGSELPPTAAFTCTPDVAVKTGKVEATCTVAVGPG